MLKMRSIHPDLVDLSRYAKIRFRYPGGYFRSPRTDDMPLRKEKLKTIQKGQI